MRRKQGWQLAFALALVGCGGTSETAEEVEADSISAKPVELVHAWRYSGSKYGFHWTDTWFRVVVEDRAHDKQVDIWTEGYDGVWKAIPASYVQDVGGNREVWEAEEHTDSDKASGAFVVRYQVAGRSYWDNDNGADYEFKDSGGLLADGVNVGLYSHYSTFGDASYYIAVDVQNIAYDKRVEVIYSTDDWRTVRSARLSFSGDYIYGYGHVHSPNVHGVERWHGSIDMTGVEKIEFAIAYTVNGHTYWDSNFGMNYRTTRRH